MLFSSRGFPTKARRESKLAVSNVAGDAMLRCGPTGRAAVSADVHCARCTRGRTTASCRQCTTANTSRSWRTYSQGRAHQQNCLHTASTPCSHAPPMLPTEEESLAHKNMTVRKDDQRQTAKRDNHSGTKPQDNTPCSTLDWGACQHREWGNGPKP